MKPCEVPIHAPSLSFVTIFSMIDSQEQRKPATKRLVESIYRDWQERFGKENDWIVEESAMNQYRPGGE